MGHTIPVTRINEKKEVVSEYTDVILKVDYFWDSHGKLVPWNDSVEDPTFWSHAKVRRIKYSFTEKLLGKEFDFEMHQLEVNGKIISGDCVNIFLDQIDNQLVVKCWVTVGWG